jgi:hypothetical protein
VKTGQFFCPVFCLGKNCYNRKKQIGFRLTVGGYFYFVTAGERLFL